MVRLGEETLCTGFFFFFLRFPRTELFTIVDFYSEDGLEMTVWQ